MTDFKTFIVTGSDPTADTGQFILLIQAADMKDAVRIATDELARVGRQELKISRVEMPSEIRAILFSNIEPDCG